ncbi:hypothetical protein ACIRD2_08350 [Streptomyces sp. NPDC093595]|uniref:hypothetical protein n=1 Tax=Streptomyces sp. NPDC093595 TaxID=3366045 RepID=UPI00381664C4
MVRGAVGRGVLALAAVGVLVVGCGSDSGREPRGGGGSSAGGSEAVTGGSGAWDGATEPPDGGSPSRTPGSPEAGRTDGAGPTRTAGTTRPTVGPRAGTATSPGPRTPSASSGPGRSARPPARPERPGGTNGGGGGGGGTAERCGVIPPAGTQDGRRKQRLVFPSPGTHHTFPHTSAPLRGCATSGLPVLYAVDGDVEPANCRLVPHGRPTRVEIDGNSGGCTIVASQPGDGTWAPAAPVRQRFKVGHQPVTLSWADEPFEMRYPGPVTVRVRVDSPDPVDAYISMQALGACGFADDEAANPLVHGRSLVTVTVVLRDPGPSGRGECTLGGHVVSDHTLSKNLPQRTYPVAGRAGTSRGPAPGPSPA